MSRPERLELRYCNGCGYGTVDTPWKPPLRHAPSCRALAADIEEFEVVPTSRLERGASGPFDPDELVRWAETYGHPEEWVKRAQAAHMRGERLLEAVAAHREAIEAAGTIDREPTPEERRIFEAKHAADQRLWAALDG